MFLSVFGHLNIDFILNVPRIPDEGSILTNATILRPGGTARNISLAAALLGIDNEIFSKVGKDFPKEFILELKEKGVSIENILIDTKYKFSPICIIVSDFKKQLAFIDQGPMGDHGLNYKNFPSGRIVHFGTGDPEEYIKIKSIIDKETAFDPGQEIEYRYTKENLIAMLEGSKYVFFNEREYEKAKEILHDDITKYAENIIVTLGENGCMGIKKGEKFNLDAYKVKAKETIGAGDSFRAGFYLGIKNKINFKKSCLIGMKIASIVVENGKIPKSFPPIDEIMKSP